ncbi:recombinase family protein [Leptolyngbya sp. AN03gr2]|uniref:recombinase family protein n=1 Tax=Leptolyngbya sp. AN03gr2 TaxID=3423364 RepID=UPI003D3107C5
MTKDIDPYNIGYGRISQLDYGRRVSHTDLDVAAQQQRSRLERAGCHEIYFDLQPGSEDDRPDFERLLDRMKRRDRVDRVTITRDDRITRSPQVTLDLIEVFLSQNIELVILDMGDYPIDLTNPYQWKQRVQAGLDAAFEIKMLGMRIRRGYEYFRQTQKANPAVPFGYRRSREGRYERDPEQWEFAERVIKTFFETRSLNKTCRVIEQVTGRELRTTTLRYWLRNQVLQGNTPYKIDKKTKQPGEIIYGTHSDVLITPEQALIINEVCRENQKLGGKRHNILYPLGSGLCRCRKCGSTMGVRKLLNGNPQELAYILRCTGASKRIPVCDFNSEPRSFMIEPHIIAALTEKAVKITDFVSGETTKKESPEITALRIQRSYLLATPGDKSNILPLIENIDNQIKALEFEETQTDRVSNYTGETFKSLSHIYRSPEYWKDLDPSTRRELFRQFVEVVWVSAVKIPGSRFVNYQIEPVLKF